MGKALGSKNLMVAFFICNPPPLHGRSYEKSRKMKRDRTVDILKNDCNRPQDRPVPRKLSIVENLVKIYKILTQNIKM